MPMSRSPVQDLPGPGFTLLNVGADAVNVATLVETMRPLGAPFEMLLLPEARLRSACGRKLLLVRPDLHAAWRGDDTTRRMNFMAARA